MDLPLLTLDTLTYTVDYNGFARAKPPESDIDVKSRSYSISLESIHLQVHGEKVPYANHRVFGVTLISRIARESFPIET